MVLFLLILFLLKVLIALYFMNSHPDKRAGLNLCDRPLHRCQESGILPQADFQYAGFCQQLYDKRKGFHLSSLTSLSVKGDDTNLYTRNPPSKTAAGYSFRIRSAARRMRSFPISQIFSNPAL